MKSMILQLALLLVLPGAAFASKPPAAVIAAFKLKFANAKEVEWSKEKDGTWEAEFELPGSSEMSASFSPEGQWLETETEIKVSTLPAPVLAALHGKKVKEAARIEKADGSIIYEAEVKRKDLLFDAAGKRLN